MTTMTYGIFSKQTWLVRCGYGIDADKKLIGQVVRIGNRFSFKANPDAAEFMQEQHDSWLKQFRAHVIKRAKEWDARYSFSYNDETGIELQAI